MKESRLSAESKKEITREEVIAGYKKFIEQGVKSPDDLDLNDSAVQEANELFYKWQEQEARRVAGDEEAEKRSNLSKTMLYVDAGFTEPDYLKEILQDWLVQDAQNMEKQIGNSERNETRRQMAAAMKKIRKILYLLAENPGH